MFQEQNEILWNDSIGSSYYKIGIRCCREYKDAQPGQFVMVRLPDRIAPLLRRPFSIHRLIRENDILKGFEVLYKVVGTFTEKLSRCKEGDLIDVLGPLGNSFRITPHAKRIFMIAGGVGVAPMVFLAEMFEKKGLDLSQVTVFIGGRSKDDVLCTYDFPNLGSTVCIATDDGSEGEKGLITAPLETAIRENRPDVMYACGPTGMLKAVSKIAEKEAISCQISIETMMACGMGACLGCAVRGKNNDKYLHACMDGPVFDSRILNL